MTEQEIISYLKENRKKGTAFAFMPEDVQKWCEEHCDETIFHIFSDTWLTLKSTIFCEPQGIYCLPTAYKPEPEFEPDWEEFPIDTEGFFCVRKGVDSIYYHWWQWTKFLDENYVRYNDFGGWVYEAPLSNGEKTEVLVTSPRILERSKDLSSLIILNGKNESKPAYPTKILFWRYKE